MKRAICVVLYGAAAVASHASYELAFVADFNVVGTSKARIHRYDVPTGSFLGTFGENYYNYVDIVANGANGKLYALDSSQGLLEYDYSTGLLLRVRTGTPGTSIGLSADGSEVYVYEDSTVKRIATSSLAESGTITLAATGSATSVQRLGNQFYALCRSGDTWTYQRFGMDGSILQTSTSWTSSASAGNVGYVSTGIGATPNALMSGQDAGSAMRYAFVTPNGSLNTAAFYSPSTGVWWRDVAPLHTGGVFVGMDAADGTRGIVAVAGYTGGVFRSFGTGQLHNPIAISTVVAPEPASLAVLGLGLTLVARRRRKR